MLVDKKTADATLEALTGIPDKLPLLVIGDLMLDHYVFGAVKRISPEAPVPVLDVRREIFRPGGAANVADVLINLGASVSLLGFLGNDNDGLSLQAHFVDLLPRGLGIVTNLNFTTECKTRFMAGPHQLLRVDSSGDSDPATLHVLFEALCDRLPEWTSDVRGLICSDYNKGVFSDELIAKVVGFQLPIYLDCKPARWPAWKNSCSPDQRVTLVLKPNRSEFELMGGSLDKHGMIVQGGAFYTELLTELLVTLGPDGAVLALDSLKTQYRLYGTRRETFNVIGAGDMTLAVYAWCRAGGMSPYPAALVANAAASEMVRHVVPKPMVRKELTSAVCSYLDC